MALLTKMMPLPFCPSGRNENAYDFETVQDSRRVHGTDTENRCRATDQ
jgi:hypothetical protein